MKYFKHHCNASDREFIRALLEKFGHEGYVLWFQILEVLGQEVEKEIESFRRGSASKIRPMMTTGIKWLAQRCHSSPERLLEFARFAQKKGKYSVARARRERDQITIECPNFLSNIDEYTRKLVNEVCKERGIDPREVLTVSGESPEEVRPKQQQQQDSPSLTPNPPPKRARKPSKAKAKSNESGQKETPEGTAGGAVVVVQDRKEPDSGPPAPADPRKVPLELLNQQVSGRLSAPILESLGVEARVLLELSGTYPAVRILHVAEHAKKQENPAGFAIKALKDGWTVPDSNGTGLAKMHAALEAEALARSASWAKMAGGGILKRAADYPVRAEGETEDEYFKRVNEWTKSKKAAGGEA